MRTRSERSTFVGSVVVALVVAPAVSARDLFWSDWGTAEVQRAPLEIGSPTTLVSGLPGPYSVTLDLDHDHIYLSSWLLGQIERTDLDGGNHVVVIADGGSAASGITIDGMAGKLYWCDLDEHKIRRANLDGTSIEEIVTTGLNMPRDLTLEPIDWKLYWLSEGDGVVRRCNLDGTEVEDLTSVGVVHPSGLALDGEQRRMYWLDFTLGTIYSADFDGFDVQLVLDELDSPSGLALDRARQVLYWSSQSTDRIRRATTSGVILDDFVNTGLSAPFRLTIDPRSDLIGDFDIDGDVDLSDFNVLVTCFGGSLNPPATTCPPGVDADLDADLDVDASDFLLFAQHFTGAR